MRILMILPEYPPSVGGMQTHAAFLSHHLAAKGHPIAVVTYRLTDPAALREAAAHDSHLRFPVHRVLSRLGFWYNIDTIIRFATRFKPDVVYASTVFYGLLRSRLAVPVVCRSVGNDLLRPWLGYPFGAGSRLFASSRIEKMVEYCCENADYPEWVEALLREKRFAVMRNAVRGVSRILANSAFTAELLREMGVSHDRIDTLVGGVDTGKFGKPASDVPATRRRLGLPEEGAILLTACRLVAKKGVDLLLHAAQRLAARLPAVHLVIVGEGRYREKLRRLAAELGIEKTVTFTGRVPHDIIHQYYWCCDLFVLASRVAVNPFTGSQDVETMGRVLCEANAAGIPVVASRSGGIPSIVTHEVNGLLFEENSLEGLIRQVLRVHQDPDLSGRLVRNGLRRARDEFDWSVILDHHERVFAESATRTVPIRRGHVYLPQSQCC